MSMRNLYSKDDHVFMLLEGYGHGEMVPTNQVLIRDGKDSILLDPGGHKVHYDLMHDISGVIPIDELKYLFFSHQDPDIVAAANAWLMLTDAVAYISELWLRFIPHFGVDELLIKRLKGIPDAGMRLEFGRGELLFLPAHFLHSAGNFQVYDPISKTLFTGDLGASIAPGYVDVTNFDAHVRYMEPFHLRYMPSAKANQLWARMARGLDIERIVPQHGAIFPDRRTSTRFIEWISTLPGAVDVISDTYKIPAPPA